MILPRPWTACRGVLAAAVCAGCVDANLVASDCHVDSGLCKSNLSGSGDYGASNGGPNVDDDAGTAFRNGAIARVDLLLVIDRSASMVEERAAFTSQLAPLLHALFSGDIDGGGHPEFLQVSDLHVALVSSDLGAGTASGSCSREGDAAELLMDRDDVPSGCVGAPGGYFSIQRAGDVDANAERLGCWIRQLDQGCRIEQPLAAAVETMGRANAANLEASDAGGLDRFARPDSLHIVLVLADEDDCSASDAERLLVSGDRSATACATRPELLRSVRTLASSLRNGREQAPDLSLLAVFTGVPPNLVDVTARARYSLESGAGREAFYTALLQDPRMTPVVSAAGSEADGDHVGLEPACKSGDLVGYPAPRLVEAVSTFGAQGVVQSVCDPNAWQVVAHTIGRRLGPPVL